jgi:hypothetical protein
MRHLILASAAAAIAFAQPVLASTNLVTNGSFETGDFTGWSQFGNTSFTGVNGPGNFSGVNPTDGDYQAFFGAVGSVGGIMQTVSTVAGKTYYVSYDLYNFGGIPSSFSATFNGVTLSALNDPPAFGYSRHTFAATAAGSSANLVFGLRHDPSYYLLDNVSIAVPEASTWALMIAGFGLVGFAARRRRSDIVAA